MPGRPGDAGATDDHFLQDVRAGVPTTWVNQQRTGVTDCDITLAEVQDADARLRRFAPFLAETFSGPWHIPLPASGEEEPGVIDSPLTPVPRTAAALGLPHPLWLKRDDVLPVSGSIKARGGIYEVLAVAERVALEAGWGARDLDTLDYRDFGSPDSARCSRSTSSRSARPATWGCRSASWRGPWGSAPRSTCPPTPGRGRRTCCAAWTPR
ncbi:hypothetical protein GCM10025883_24300 [Mobilicoccus caccae]|uniref:Pyridoxal-phosphate dependent enzyme n=1 Tax=Mobilicoccus caccae TaxID=1859295 RepID=A0ABQ6IR30_9MICO|nr:hypothetical protein GCM10025883_24300 [Mobilicoccus caccae]